MTKLEKAMQLAQANLGRSVVRINATAQQEQLQKQKEYSIFGVKNTEDIPDSLINKLRQNEHFLFLTIDKMADLGRSVDIDLVNPLTYRCMTGSTSGGCVNILKGITDLCIGTDGGGSVLAPALSTNLYSFMGKGVGLMLKKDSLSTDGLPFAPGVGVISTRLNPIRKAIQALTGRAFTKTNESIRIMTPASGCMMLPTGEDAHTVLQPILSQLPQQFIIQEHTFADCYNRAALVEEINRLIAADVADLFLTLEGPIDVYSYDETIPKKFEGPLPETLCANASKAFVKAVNICGCSGFTIPHSRLATGFVVTCPCGWEKADMGYTLACELEKLVSLPAIFEKYFINREKYVTPSRFE